MIQNKIKNQINDKEIEEFFQIFYENTMKKENIEPDKNEWDMRKRFEPTYACIWNDIKNISKPCFILFKDERLALVQFEEETKTKQIDTFRKIYRLEDIGEIK